MRRIIHFILTTIALACLFSCKQVSMTMDDYDADDMVLNYKLGSVLQYDLANTSGVEIVDYYEPFSSLRFKIKYEGGKVVSATFDNGKLPFSPYSFDVPEGEIECYLDLEHSPYALKMKSNDNVLAYFKSGEYIVSFQLDCNEIKYEYRFTKSQE